ncbi:UbiA family prenyltransferase [Amycolatopsis lurida]
MTADGSSLSHNTSSGIPVRAEDGVRLPRLRAFLVVSRVEFMPGGLFFIFASAALACLSWTALGENLPVIAAGAVVWYLSHLIGSQVNCLADRDIDREHKARLAAAVAVLGTRSISVALGVEAAAALGVATGMAVATGRPVLPFLWLAGFAVAMAYSLEPVRLKRRVWLNPASLLLVLYAFPMMFGYLALVGSVQWAALGVIAGTAAQMLALILLNPAEDIATDRAGGVATPCTVHGLGVVAPLAAAVYLAGTAVTFWSLAELAGGRGILVHTGLALVAAAQLFVFGELARLAALSRRAADPGAAGRTNRLLKRNPVHFALLGITLAAAGGLVVR